MSDEPPRRSGRSGGLFVAFVVVGSFVGVIGWYLNTNRTGPVIDASGFDMDKAPVTRRAMPVLSADSAPQQQASSLGMLKGDKGVSIGVTGPAAQAAGPGAADKPVDKKAEAHASFTEQARKHEGDVVKYSMKMEKKFPILKRYARDWMSHPDLKKLNDDYMRNHDPVAFIMGLTKAPSLGTMVKQYAGNPAIIGYITQGMKEAPGDLTGSAMDVLTNDSTVKGLIGNIASGLGLPPSVTGMIGGGGDPSKIDQNKMMSDIVNSQAGQDAMKQQGAPPVSLQH
jgi:hypothetical protein